MNNLQDTLEYYQKFSRKVRKEIELIRDDVMQKEQGIEVIYCLDFSEIFAYVNGGNNFFSGVAGYEICSNDEVPIIDMMAVHNVVVEHMLFYTIRDLVFLKPYMSNLIRYYDSLRLRAVRKKARELASGALQHRLRGTDPEFQEIQKFAEDVRNGKALTEAQWQKISEFRQQNASFLDALSQSGAELELSRLNNLALKEGYNVDFYLKLSLTRNEDVFDRWRKLLTHFRPDVDSANYDDAEAIGLLFSANQQLKQSGSRKKLCLVTRSYWMHKLFDEEYRKGLWDEVGGHVLRHPLCFIGLIDEISPEVETIDHRKELQVIDRWLNTFSEVAEYDPKTPADCLALQRVTSVLGDTWREYSNLLSSACTVVDALDDEDPIIRAVRILTNEDAYREEVYRNLDALFSNMERAHFCMTMLHSNELGSALELVDPKDRNLSSRRARSDPFSRDKFPFVRMKTVHGTPMPFVVYFESDRISQQLSENADSPWSALNAMVDDNILSVARGKEKQEEYEWYVGMAYVLASLGAWGQAGQCARMALDVIKRSVQTTEFSPEADYIYSKCYRHHKPSTEGLCEAFYAISKARRLITKQMKLRFVSERLKVAFRLLVQGRKENFDELALTKKIGKPLKAYIISLRDQGKRIAQQITVNDCEKSDFYNNFVYHSMQLHNEGFLEAEEICRLSDIPKSFLLFCQETKKNFGEPKDWPDNYLDTYIWVYFLLKQKGLEDSLRDRIGAQELADLAKRLKSRRFVSEFDQRDFSDHYEEILQEEKIDIRESALGQP